MIKKMTFLLAFLVYVTQLSAQDRVISGKIMDENGASLPGATVMLKGTNKGVVTDVDGNYQLSVPQAGGTLQFSYVGYTAQEVQIETENTINIKLSADVKSLNEVVVVGYGIQRKSDLTGSVVSVKASDIQRVPVTTTDQILQGRAAGVSVTANSGTPGAALQIRVRGVGTINNASPLYVVDGFPMEEISFLNPSDISSMEVLKDASATAIYGSRGANGVIMITTKDGKGNEAPVITVDAYSSISEMWQKPNLLNASQWAKLRIEALNNSGLPISSTDSTLLDYNSFGQGTDWVKEVTRKAYSHNLNFSISGGTDKTTYFISANNFMQEGIVKKTDFERNTFRINTSVKAKKWLTIGENLTIESNKTHKVNENDEWSAVLIQAVTLDPATPVRRSNGGFSSSDYVQMTNPVANIEHTNSEDRNVRFIGNAFAEVTFIKSLSFKSNLGISYDNGIYNSFQPTYEFFYSDNSVNSSTSVYNSNVSRSNTESKSWNWSNYFTYANQFDAHNISVMAGIESSRDFVDPFSALGNNLVGETVALRNFDNALDPVGSVSGSWTDKRMFSYYGRLNYDYAEKYLFTANIRRDGSSIFGPDQRWGTFPSFSVGWKVNKEPFMANVGFINNLKIRAGWGKIGNDKIPAYRFLNIGYAGSKYILGETIVNGVYFPGTENKKLHWEATTTSNFGLDLGVVNNKVTLTADYYIKKTNDMLVDVPAPFHVGYQINPYKNIGTMENKGFELELSYKDSWSDFSWEIGANIATSTNKVTSLGQESEIQTAPLRNGGYVSMTRVGSPIAQFWGRKTQGLFQTQKDIDNWKDKNGNPLQPDAKPGDIRYAKNADTTGIYEGVIGNPLPDFTYGFNIVINYKNFDLNMFFQGVYGNDIFNGTMVYTDRPDVATNLSNRMLNRWTGENTTNDAHYPRLDASNASNILFSDRYVEDGSYLRLKNVQLGYTIPKSISQKFNIQKLRVYIGATNLFTITNYKGFDPEIGEGYYGSLDMGIDRATYPQPKTYLVGLNLTF